jgi:hypothetical protein
MHCRYPDEGARRAPANLSRPVGRRDLRSGQEGTQKLVAVVGTIAGAVLALFSLAPRLQNLESPLLERHGFRQTQTAISVRGFMHNGIDFLNYETPVFGPPWQVPFELPVFQASAAVLAYTGLVNGSLDKICRVTAVLYFYLSAALLYCVCSLFLGRGVSLLAVVVYVWTPFNLLWSKTCMIDYAAVAFALAYLYTTMRWLRRPQNPVWLVAGIVSGSLTGAVKITTLPVVAVPLAALILDHIAVHWLGAPRAAGAARVLKAHWLELVGLLLVAVVPATLSLLWTHHADSVKGSSMFASWLTSTSLKGWNFGTWEQRVDSVNWRTIAERIYGLMAPAGVALMPIVAFVSLPRLARETRIFVVTLAGGVILTITIFFNLYVVHDYYLIAVAPGIAILVAVGLAATATNSAGRLARGRCVVAVVLLASAAIALRFGGAFQMLSDHSGHPELAVARMIQEHTAPGDLVVLGLPHLSWDPTIPYYADRKACTLRDDGSYPRVDPFLVKHSFHFAALHMSHPAELRHWKKELLAETNGFHLYRIEYQEGNAVDVKDSSPSEAQPLSRFDFEPGANSQEGGNPPAG